MKTAMKLMFFALGVTLSWSLIGHASDSRPPAIAITVAGGRCQTDSTHSPRVIVAVWPDGRIIWSEDPKGGGPPFREAKIEVAKIEDVFSKFEKRSVFEGSFRRSWFGPGATYHSIFLDDGRRRARVESWHELFETNPDLVVIDGSITSLRGRAREDLLATNNPEFRAFRELWADLRTAIASLIPEEGAPVDKPVELNLPGSSVD
jgi:hypothetical protein